MKASKIKYLIGTAIIFVSFSALAQTFPIIPVPKTINPNTIYQNVPNNRPQTNIYNPNELTDIQKRNNEMVRRDMEEMQRNINAEIQRQSAIKMLINSGFPSQSSQPGTSCYYEAFNEIDSMLKGQIPMNLGRAIFLVENAYYENSINYADYRKAIKDKVAICQDKIREEKLDGQDNMVKNIMLFSMLTDTMKIRTGGKIQTNYPVKYDLNDYQSKTSYDSHFVTKLMQKGIGQCHSMPLYFLVLSEEMGSEAYWSFSPKHSFVKIKDENEAWFNLEITCGAVLTDAHYMNSGYIKSEALQNRIYLEPLDKTNTIAEMLIQLAGGYGTKYGLDDFYLKCVETAGAYLKNDLNVLQYKANYQTQLTLALARLLEAPKPDIMKEKSPEAYKQYEAMISLYKQIDDLGYEELPPDLYADWLDHVAKLKEQSKKEDKPMFLLRKLE